MENKDKIFHLCRSFENENFMGILPDIFKVIEERKIKNHELWRFDDYYMVAEKDAYISEYLKLRKNQANSKEIVSLVKATPFYNRPFDDLIKNKTLDQDLAGLIFNRLLTIDFENPTLSLFEAAKVANENGDFSKLIGKLKGAQNYFDVSLAAEYFDLAENYVSKKRLVEAIICFINALVLKSADSEEFNNEAFRRIEELSKLIEDKNFCDYVGEYMVANSISRH